MTTQPFGLASGLPGFSKGWAILLIVLGFLALALPFAAGIAIAIAVAILIIAAAVIHLAGAFATRTAGAFLWRLLVGGVYLIAGGFLLAHPRLDLVSLTLVLAIVFFAESVFLFATYFHLRRSPGSAWLLIDGIVTLILAVLIWKSWPASAVWAVGTLFGVNLLITGFARLMYTSAGLRSVPPPGAGGGQI